ncbi:S-adenosylmethionine uptake transporter [Rubricella aquisinus]|uniref:S-adenosylmethionine uptake transporter n=1 Tax=Rubricella aquisinus TaxID=2028108 RepID=A0A840WMP4_9RHOB|nr:DMT family transporter [Rubricella aquisinus]MBB5516329.1 S-adenosylmethionine uptake transporter [Rubricella aquisinus]
MKATLAQNLRGAVLMIAAMGAFRGNDAAMKAVLQDLPFSQAVFLRGLCATLLLFVIAWRSGALAALPRGRDRRAVALCVTGEMGSTLTYLTAIALVPLSVAVAILQGVPLILTIAGALLFGETVGWRRWIAVFVGLAGVLMIIQPGADGFNVMSLLVVATVFCIALRDLAARSLTAAVPSQVMALITGAMVTLLALVLSIGSDWVMPTPGQSVIIVTAAVLVSLAYIFAVSAIRAGDVGFVAPFRYSGLLWAAALGILLFGERPGPWQLTGAAIVVATGLFILHRERVAAR